MSTPTLADFLAESGDEDEYLPPLESIAHSLRTIAASYAGPEPESGGKVPGTQYDDLLVEFSDMEAKAQVMFELIEEVEAIIKPSTSKLANYVREAIERWKKPEVQEAAEVPEEGAPAPEPTSVGMPTYAADVEEWRLFARSLGYQGADVDDLNRSQIRTLLGIEQPVSAES